MSHAPYNRFQPEVFLRWLKVRGDVEVVFKWHPVAHKDMIEKALGDLTSWPFIHSVQDFDTYALLAASDVCITVGNSTTGIEALVFGKPLIDIALPDQAYSFAGLGVAEPATGFEDIGPLLEQIFAHGLTAERKQHIEAYLAQSFASQDGNTVGRVVQMAEEMLLAKQPEVSHPPVLPVTKAGRFPCSLILPVDDTPLPHVMATLRGIAAHVPAELFDIIIVNAAAGPETRALLESLGGDIRVMTVAPGTSFADCCNRAAAEAEGTYVVFLKPVSGMVRGIARSCAARTKRWRHRRSRGE
jgi:hypothetical protein